MSIRVEDCLRKIKLPKRYFNDKFDICEKFKEEAEEYLKLLKLIDGSEFEPDKAEIIRNKIEGIIDEIQKNVDAIINIFAYHEEANPKAAQEEIDAMMERMKNDVFMARSCYAVSEAIPIGFSVFICESKWKGNL